MTLLPIVVRELKVAAGRRSLHVLRVAGAASGIAVLCWLFLVDTTGGISLDGRRLLQLLGWTAFWFCLIAGGVTTANAIGRERREGTLGLLFLTDLRGNDVVLGKLAVASLPLVGGVVGFLPLLAFSFLLGGVNPADVLLIAVVLANTLFLSLSLGLLVSAVGRNESRSLTAAVLLPMVVAFGPYVVGQLVYGAEDREPFSQLPGALLSPSPAYALTLVYEDIGVLFKAQAFWGTMAVVQLTGWVALMAAAVCVLKSAREGVSSPWVRRLQELARGWVFGSGQARARRRARLLSVNPLVWLASRHRHKTSYLWLFVVSMGLIAVWSGLQTQGIWFEWKPALGFLLILHAAMKLCFISESCHRLGMDRQQGGFELILTTPTDVRSVADGHAIGLKRTFVGPLMAMMLLDLVWLWLDWARPEPDHDRWVMGLILVILWGGFFLDVLAVRWISLWQMLVAPTAAKAAQACVLRVQWLPMLVFLGIAVPMDWAGRNTASARGREAVVVGLLAVFWGLVSAANAMGWLLWCRYLFMRRCRVVASEGADGAKGLGRVALEELRKWMGLNWREPLQIRFWLRHPMLGMLAVVCCVALAALGYKHLTLRRELSRGLDSVREFGVPITDRELGVWQPKVKDSSNAVVQFRLALERLNVTPGVRVEPVLLPGRLSPLTPRMRTAYEELLRTNALALAGVEKALMQSSTWFDPGSQFAFVPGRFRGSLPLRMSGMLLARIALDIEDDRVDAACEEILTILRLAEFVGSQPRCTGQNVRHATLHQAMDALERLLARKTLTVKQLDRMRGALLTAHESQSMRRALEGELWLVSDAWRHQRFTLSSFTQAPLQSRDVPESIRLGVGQLGGLLVREFLTVLEASRQSIVVLNLRGPERVNAAQQMRDTNGPAGYYYSDGPQLIQNLGGTLVGHLVCLARLRAAIVALELEQGRGVSGGPIGNLSDIPATAVAKGLLQDPFAEGTLRVIRRERGFAVASRGTHGEDVTWVNRFTGRETDDSIRFVVDR